MSENYKFFQNRDCEFFPCHNNVNNDEFNCLFCYCPLYMLKNECGGDFKMTSGVKDCSDCNNPHDSGSFAFIMSAMKNVIEIGSDF